jgi:transposase
MKNTGLRTLTREARNKLKVVSLRMYKAHHKQNEISETLGIRESTIINWLKAYKQTDALKQEAKHGRPLGNGRKLSLDQESHIKKMESRWSEILISSTIKKTGCNIRIPILEN